MIHRFDFRNGGVLRQRYDALKYMVKRLLGDSARLPVSFGLDEWPLRSENPASTGHET